MRKNEWEFEEKRRGRGNREERRSSPCIVLYWKLGSSRVRYEARRDNLIVDWHVQQPHARLRVGHASPFATSIIHPTTQIFFSLYNLMSLSNSPVVGRRQRDVTPLNSCIAYRNLAMELIFLCRFFVQTHEQNSNSSIRLRK